MNTHSNFLVCFLVTGRCWIFSCLNVMRLPFMKKLNIEEFEFSQSYLFFWDKVWDWSCKAFFFSISVGRDYLFISCFSSYSLPSIIDGTPFILISKVSKVDSLQTQNCFWLVGGYSLQWNNKSTDSPWCFLVSFLAYLKFFILFLIISPLSIFI